jgi:hypothetical protein
VADWAIRNRSRSSKPGVRLISVTILDRMRSCKSTRIIHYQFFLILRPIGKVKSDTKVYLILSIGHKFPVPYKARFIVFYPQKCLSGLAISLIVHFQPSGFGAIASFAIDIYVGIISTTWPSIPAQDSTYHLCLFYK